MFEEEREGKEEDSHAILGQFGFLLQTVLHFPLASDPHFGPLQPFLTRVEGHAEHSYCSSASCLLCCQNDSASLPPREKKAVSWSVVTDRQPSAQTGQKKGRSGQRVRRILERCQHQVRLTRRVETVQSELVHVTVTKVGFTFLLWRLGHDYLLIWIGEGGGRDGGVGILHRERRMVRCGEVCKG